MSHGDKLYISPMLEKVFSFFTFASFDRFGNVLWYQIIYRHLIACKNVLPPSRFMCLSFKKNVFIYFVCFDFQHSHFTITTLSYGSVHDMFKTTRYKGYFWYVIHTFSLTPQDSKIFFTFLNVISSQTNITKWNGVSIYSFSAMHYRLLEIIQDRHAMQNTCNTSVGGPSSYIWFLFEPGH